jgi:hypothetical protein
MNKQTYKYLKIMIIVIIVCVILYLVNKFAKSSKMGFSNYNLANPGSYPLMDSVPLLTGDYKYSGNKNVSNDNYDEIWWHYPIFRVGSYKQITNNLRYYRNPDEGTCVRAEFCGALYKDKKTKSNIVVPLQPTPVSPYPRVNYYNTNVNAFPHTTNPPVVLY